MELNTRMCSYCGSTSEPLVNENRRLHKIRAKKKNLSPRYPICGVCWHKLYHGKISSSSNVSDFVVLTEAEACFQISHNLSRASKIEEIVALVDKVELLVARIPSLVEDFNAKADSAAAAAKRLEVVRAAVEKAKEMVFRRLDINYEHCRAVANRHISQKEIRKAVFERDGHRCVACGSEFNLSIDHKRPVLLGGPNDISNYQTLCISCNSSKGARFQKSEAAS